MKSRIVFIFFLLITLALPKAFAQTEAPLAANIGLKLTLTKMKPDDKGTDVSNIYTIAVEYQNQEPDGLPYNIIYYLDGNYVEEFRNQTLPFSFTRDFRGQLEKPCDIRIDLESPELKIVGRQTATVTVDHP
jgi:hypothetical protein